MEYLSQHIEGLIFTAPQPLSLEEIQDCLEETFETSFSEDDLLHSIGTLQQKYQQDEFSFEILHISGGYQFMSKGAYHNTIGTYLKQTTKKQLSRAALETLSIVAYKQPVTKTEVEKIRGVSCDYALQKLLEKELVDIIGRDESPGRPLLYATSRRFMDYFGLASLKDLPKPRDFKIPENVIGEAAPIEESMLVEVEASKVQIGNINTPPLVVLDRNGEELVVPQMSPLLENAIDVISSGVALLEDKSQTPESVAPTPVIRKVEQENLAASIIPVLDNQILNDAVEDLIGIAAIFDLPVKEVPMISEKVLRQMEKGIIEEE